jgi:hypothetical protein
MSSRLVVTGGRWHTYSLDGVRVPSVTGIIGKAVAKPALVKWSARLAAEWAAAHHAELTQLGEASWVTQAARAPDVVRDTSATAGKQVHSIAQALIYGEPVETADPESGELYSDDVVRMGEQVARFQDAWQVSPDDALVELPVFNDEHGYAGTFDLCATLRGGDSWLIDYKTGQSGVWNETALQLTAYSRATHVQIGDRDLLMRPVQRCAALWVRPDAWELIPVKSDDYQWHAFVHAIEVAAWAALRRDDVIGGALPIPA